MRTARRVQLGIIGNVFVVVLCIFSVTMFRDDASKYYRFGSHDDLILISVRLNTWGRYFTALTIIAIIQSSKTIFKNLAKPFVHFATYDDNRTVITEFGKLELQIYTNTIFFLSILRSLLTTVVAITQIDIGIFGLIVSEAVLIITIRMMLNRKTFIKEGIELLDISVE